MPSDNVNGTLLNVDSVTLVRGMLVRVSAANGVVRAQADSAAHLQGLAGVVNSGFVGVGGPCTNVIGNSLRQPVLLETGLTPAAGDTLYVSSSTAGRAPNVAPANIVAIGTIVDVSQYSRNSMVFATVSTPGSTTGGSGVVVADGVTIEGDGSAGNPLNSPTISAWLALQTQRIRAEIPGLFVRDIPIGIYPDGATLGVAATNDGQLVGGAQLALAGVPRPFAASIWQSTATGAFAIAVRGQLPLPAGGKFNAFGLYTQGVTHDVLISSWFLTSATKYVLTIDGAGLPTVVTSTTNVVNTLEDYMITFDPAAAVPTIKAWLNGVVIAATTDVSNLTTEPMFPCSFSTDAGAAVVSQLCVGYNPP